MRLLGQPEVVAAASDEGPVAPSDEGSAAAVSLSRDGEEGHL